MQAEVGRDGCADVTLTMRPLELDRRAAGRARVAPERGARSSRARASTAGARRRATRAGARRSAFATSRGQSVDVVRVDSGASPRAARGAHGACRTPTSASRRRRRRHGARVVASGTTVPSSGQRRGAQPPGRGAGAGRERRSFSTRRRHGRGAERRAPAYGGSLSPRRHEPGSRSRDGRGGPPLLDTVPGVRRLHCLPELRATGDWPGKADTRRSPTSSA